jgi:hypothetical protein
VQAGAPFRAVLLDAVRAGGRFTVRRMPRSTLREIDVLDAAVLAAVTAINRKIMVALYTDLVRNWVQVLLDLRTAPLAEVVAALKATVGLSPLGRKAIARVTRELAGTPRAEAQTTQYRAARAAQYRDTLASTAVWAGFKHGQQLGLRQLLLSGMFAGKQVWKTWVNMGDDKVRDLHRDNGGMGGETVPWDAPYSNGDMTPGDTSWHCRCVSHYTFSQ